jgi:hypothetical protein
MIRWKRPSTFWIATIAVIIGAEIAFMENDIRIAKKNMQEHPITRPTTENSN